MIMEYSTAEEFANLIKSNRYEYAEETDDLAVRLAAIDKNYQDEIESLKKLKSRPPFSEINTKYTEVIEILKNDFFSTLPENVKNDFEKYFHFGTIDNRYMNASIVRSPNKRFFVVLINSSLITLLHRYGKLEYAVLRPHDVAFCSRLPDRKPTRTELIGMLAEMHYYYTTAKMANGPFLILKGPAQIAHSININIQEKLIFYHEVGHFLNGDLCNSATEQKPHPNFENKLSYQREYLADLTGFGLYLRELKFNNMLTIVNLHAVLYAVISMYRMQHGLQGIETDKYPHPLNRMSVVIAYYYGQTIADLVHTAIIDDQMELLASDKLPEIVLNDESYLQKIENALENIFKETENDEIKYIRDLV